MTNRPASIDSAERKRTKFSTDVLTLASGTTVAQFIGILASPILARLFAPDAFGVFALFSSIVGILAMFSTLQYEVAIVLPESDADAANLFAGSLLIMVIISLLMLPLVWMGGGAFSRWLNAPDLEQYLWLLPVLLLFGGLGAGHPVLNTWASRERHFSSISVSQVVGAVSATLSKLILGFAGFRSGGGLIMGGLVGAVSTPALLGWQEWQQRKDLFIEKVRFSEIWKSLARYRKFAVYNMPSGLLNNISWQVPPFLLAFFFSPAVVGYYAFGNQLLRLPMNLIGGSIAQAFYAHAATAYQEGNLAALVEDTFRKLVDYSFVPVLMLTVIGKELFTIFFGNEWAEAGVYIQILSVWMVFWFISSPMARLYSIIEKNEFSFWINLVIFITRVISIWLGGVLGNPRLALIFFSISGALVYGYLSFSIMVLSGVKLINIWGILAQNFALFILMGGAVFLFKFGGAHDWAQIILSGCFVAIYFAYRFKSQIRSAIKYL